MRKGRNRPETATGTRIRRSALPRASRRGAMGLRGGFVELARGSVVVAARFHQPAAEWSARGAWCPVNHGHAPTR